MNEAKYDRVYLAQTDTTVGFLSRDADKLDAVKARLPGKQFLRVYADLSTFKAAGGRVPERHKSDVRRAKRRTHIVGGRAWRIVNDSHHRVFLKPFGWMYSTSANRSGFGFERDYCEARADVIVEDFRGLSEQRPSTIVKLGRYGRRRVR